MNKKYSVLIVEDEPVVLEAIKKIISFEQIRVEEAVDVENALDKLSHERYNLVISDLMLPRSSGYDLIQITNKKHPNIPLIVITGYATLENALQSFKMGSFDFIPKPFETETFLGVVWRGLKYSEMLDVRGPNPQTCIPIPTPSGKENNSCDLFCLGAHAWIKLYEDETALIGLGETFPGMISGLNRLEYLTSTGQIIQGKSCVQLITDRGLVNMFWAPLSGRVVAYNRDLEHNIEYINTDPFGKGWLLRIVASNLEHELKNLTCCRKQSMK